MDTVEDTAALWAEDVYEASASSTILPDILDKEENAMGTLIIIIIAAVLTIVLLFVIALFIDYRQQKLIKLKVVPIRKVLKLKLPTIARRHDDRESFADKMQLPETPSPSTIV